MKTKPLLLVLFTACLMTSCLEDQVDITVESYTDDEYAALQKVLDLPRQTLSYDIQLPFHLGNRIVPGNNHQATLGRVLFYDNRLSANGQVSCASCHKPEHAFADNVAFSKGFNGEHTRRNSLGLGVFPSFATTYGFTGARLFWDERAATVTEQTQLTLRDPVEMGNADLDELASRLLDESYYRILFQKAFPERSFDHFNTDKDYALIALDAFMRSISSFETPFDKGIQQTRDPAVDFPGYSESENLGKALFLETCVSCHSLISGQGGRLTANNGLDVQYEDKGVGAITNEPSNAGVFKVPNLRNIALTAPYMHDGRFGTLEEVLEHYNSGIQNHPNLHHLLKNGSQPKRLNLTPTEKKALLDFLHTLTDRNSLLQEKYADPFR